MNLQKISLGKLACWHLYLILIKACPAGKEQKEALALLTTRINCSFLWSLTTSKPYPAYCWDTLFYFPSRRCPWQCPMLVMNLFYIQYAQSDLSPEGLSAATNMSFAGRKKNSRTRWRPIPIVPRGPDLFSLIILRKVRSVLAWKRITKVG